MENTGHVPSFYNPRAVPGGDGTHLMTMGCQRAWFNHPSPHTQYLMKWFKISLAIQLKVTVLAVIQSFRGWCLSLFLLFPSAHHLFSPSSCVFQQWAETSNVFASPIRKHSTTVTSGNFPAVVSPQSCERLKFGDWMRESAWFRTQLPRGQVRCFSPSSFQGKRKCCQDKAEGAKA